MNIAKFQTIANEHIKQMQEFNWQPSKMENAQFVWQNITVDERVEVMEEVGMNHKSTLKTFRAILQRIAKEL